MQEQIRNEAYLLWEKAGKPYGQDQYFWDLAEETFRRKIAGKTTRGTLVKVGDAIRTIKEWSKVTGNAPSTIRSRLKKGKAPEQAVLEKNSRKYRGIIDSVKLYNRVLSADEIKSNYEETIVDKTNRSSSVTTSRS